MQNREEVTKVLEFMDFLKWLGKRVPNAFETTEFQSGAMKGELNSIKAVYESGGVKITMQVTNEYDELAAHNQRERGVGDILAQIFGAAPEGAKIISIDGKPFGGEGGGNA